MAKGKRKKGKGRKRTRSAAGAAGTGTGAGAGTSHGRRGLWIGLGLGALSGALLFLATTTFDVWPLAWISMVPLLFAIERAATRRRALVFGWAAGIVANIGGFYWITHLLTRHAGMPWVVAAPIMLLLCAYQGVVFVLFAAAVRQLREFSRERLGAPLAMALIAPVLMVTFEMLVPFVFPWYMAISQAWVTPVIQIAELTGPVGVTALLMMVNGAVYDAVTETSRRRKIVPAAAAAAVLGAALVFGFVRIGQIDDARAAAPKVDVGLVQGNIPMNASRRTAQRLFQDQQRMSASLEERGADLIVWSESSYPFWMPRDQVSDYALDSPGRVRRGFDTPIVFGAITTEDDEDAPPYNSAVMIGRDGAIAGRFDKVYLLVFGEYIPFLDTFPWIESLLPEAASHFARGDEVVTFPFEHDGSDYRLGPMICYEDIIPGFARRVAALHPHLFVNITNDAWFGDTAEPYQHLALSVFRAVEHRVDMVRAVNTGVSAFIDANGRVLAHSDAVDPHEQPAPVEGLVHDMALREAGHTVYSRVGDVFGFLCLIVGFGAWLGWPVVHRLRINLRKPKE